MVEARPCFDFEATYHTLSFSFKSNPVQKETEEEKKGQKDEQKEKMDRDETGAPFSFALCCIELNRSINS
jgi:hypothetical protein